MSILPEIGEALASPPASNEQEQQDGKVTAKETVPSGAIASEKVANSSRFSEQISNITATDHSTLSEDLDFFIDHLIVAGKINTMDIPEIPVMEPQVDQTTVARTYSQSRDATDPATNLVTPTSYLEPIPRRSNILGVPGDIDN